MLFFNRIRATYRNYFTQCLHLNSLCRCDEIVLEIEMTNHDSVQLRTAQFLAAKRTKSVREPVDCICLLCWFGHKQFTCLSVSLRLLLCTCLWIVIISAEANVSWKLTLILKHLFGCLFNIVCHLNENVTMVTVWICGWYFEHLFIYLFFFGSGRGSGYIKGHCNQQNTKITARKGKM